MPQVQNALSMQLSDEISRTVLMLSERKTDMLDVDYIANQVQARIDAEGRSPGLVEYSSILNLKQMIRGHLRHNLNPILRAEREVEENQESLFEEILQDYYPAKREILDQVKPVYVRRDLLSHDEVFIIATRMRLVSERLAKHSDALIAWDKSR